MNCQSILNIHLYLFHLDINYIQNLIRYKILQIYFGNLDLLS